MQLQDSKKIHFNLKDKGCYADGIFGQKHVRYALSDLLRACDPKNQDYNILANELILPPSDDASEERDALDLLQLHTAPGLFWELSNGDLMLSEEIC